MSRPDPLYGTTRDTALLTELAPHASCNLSRLANGHSSCRCPCSTTSTVATSGLDLGPGLAHVSVVSHNRSLRSHLQHVRRGRRDERPATRYARFLVTNGAHPGRNTAGEAWNGRETVRHADTNGDGSRVSSRRTPFWGRKCRRRYRSLDWETCRRCPGAPREEAAPLTAAQRVRLSQRSAEVPGQGQHMLLGPVPGAEAETREARQEPLHRSPRIDVHGRTDDGAMRWRSQCDLRHSRRRSGFLRHHHRQSAVLLWRRRLLRLPARQGL
jgi:hypothetical protein